MVFLYQTVNKSHHINKHTMCQLHTDGMNKKTHLAFAFSVHKVGYVSLRSYFCHSSVNIQGSKLQVLVFIYTHQNKHKCFSEQRTHSSVSVRECVAYSNKMEDENVSEIAFTVFLDCLHTKIKSSTLLAKPYTQEAKHQPIFAQLQAHCQPHTC